MDDNKTDKDQLDSESVTAPLAQGKRTSRLNTIVEATMSRTGHQFDKLNDEQ